MRHPQAKLATRYHHLQGYQQAHIVTGDPPRSNREDTTKRKRFGSVWVEIHSPEHPTLSLWKPIFDQKVRSNDTIRQADRPAFRHESRQLNRGSGKAIHRS